MLDCSAAAAWCFADERTPAVLAVMIHVRTFDATVPAHLRLELANTLRTGVLKGRITTADRAALLQQFALARITVDPETDSKVWPDAVRLSDKHGLTIYDAVYLELACRLSLPLATLDADLRKAAALEEIVVLGR